jgi:glutamate racemase
MSMPNAVHAQQEATLAEQLATLVHKDSITVLVTDSGLGGLSVCAAVDSLARSTGRYAAMRLVFANALPESGSGYNRMKSLDEKVRVFDGALRGMVSAYHPDCVLIACNTLSVVYPLTSFAREARIPIIGIVSMGVDMIREELQEYPGSTAIVFGTETTIGAGTHKRLLVEQGIAPERIVLQACPDLAGKIEQDATGPHVRDAIAAFVDEATGKCETPPAHLVAALCCTHYGYCDGLFRRSLEVRTGGSVIVVDPNQRMSRLLFPEGGAVARNAPQVSVSVVSRAVITPEEIQSIGALLERVSPATTSGLKAYELKRDLFPF